MNNYRSSRFCSLFVPLFFFLAALGFFIFLSEGKKNGKNAAQKHTLFLVSRLETRTTLK